MSRASFPPGTMCRWAKLGSEWVFPGRLACEAVGNPAPGATTGIFAVVLVGETDAAWLVDAASVEEAIDIVHGTFPRAREVWRSEPLVRTEDYYRHPIYSKLRSADDR